MEIICPVGPIFDYEFFFDFPLELRHIALPKIAGLIFVTNVFLGISILVYLSSLFLYIFISGISATRLPLPAFSAMLKLLLYEKKFQTVT